jgi:hypothetical protein
MLMEGDGRVYDAGIVDCAVDGEGWGDLNRRSRRGVLNLVFLMMYRRLFGLLLIIFEDRGISVFVLVFFFDGVVEF